MANELQPAAKAIAGDRRNHLRKSATTSQPPSVLRMTGLTAAAALGIGQPMGLYAPQPERRKAPMPAPTAAASHGQRESPPTTSADA
jgi:hypothetical protein